MRPAVVSIAALTLLGGCADNMCGNTLLSRHRDPASGFIAYVFVRDCGATTDFLTNVAIGRPNEPQSEARIVFTADSDHDAARSEGPAIWLRPSWTAPRKLSIVYAERSRVFRKESSVAGVQIVYRESAPLEEHVGIVEEPKPSQQR